MSAPKLCEVCSTNHHPHQAHVFPRVSRVASVVDVKPVVANTVANPAQRAKRPVANGENASTVRSRRWRARGPNRDRYNAEQRERMRARRAAQRAQAGAT